ncbi:MAG: C4-dicarboxylate ABC transporter substrate-binding protein [Alphaproteobacteria bacterium]|nr:C4-dicarboxylate ABC transporter substrate-binding protein [Alphaproteobacteria bacterium]
MRKTTQFLTLTVAASAVALLMGVSTPISSAKAQMVDGPEVTWRVSLWGKRRAFTESLEFISKTVKERTGGKFNFQLYYGEQLSKSKENLDSVAVGAIDAALVCQSYHPGKLPAANVLDMPFLPITNFDVQYEVSSAIFGHPAVKKDFAKWNAIIFAINVLPQYEYMGKGTPPATVADFKGKRLRALGGMGRSAKKIGAVPTTVTASETYTALQRGTVDAIGFPFTYAFSAYKLDEVADWYTTNMSLGTVNCPIVANKGSWEKLPKQYQDLLNGLKRQAVEFQSAAYQKKDIENLKVWPTKMKAITIPEDQMAEFRRVAGKPIWDEWVAEASKTVPEAQELLDLLLKTAADARKKYPTTRTYGK